MLKATTGNSNSNGGNNSFKVSLSQSPLASKLVDALKSGNSGGDSNSDSLKNKAKLAEMKELVKKMSSQIETLQASQVESDKKEKEKEALILEERQR